MVPVSSGLLMRYGWSAFIGGKCLHGLLFGVRGCTISLEN